MTSTRLPGKVLEDLGGRPLLQFMLERLARSQALDAICVATTSNASDDPVADLASSLGHLVHRGSEHDVLARMADAARAAEADVAVRVTGDCPMIDASIVDCCILGHLAGGVDYCSNTVERTFPRGLDSEVLSGDLLQHLAATCVDGPEREHVTLHLYEEPGRYELRVIRAPSGLHRPTYRWTVDTDDDLRFVRAVVSELGSDFRAVDAVRLCDEQPDIVALNAHVEQKLVR